MQLDRRKRSTGEAKWFAEYHGIVVHKRASGKNHDRSRSIARVVAVGIRSARDNRSLRAIKKDASVAIIGVSRGARERIGSAGRSIRTGTA